MAGRQRQQHWFVQHLHGRQIRIVLAHGFAQQGHVQAALPQAFQLRGTLVVVQRDVDRRPFVPQPPQRGGQYARMHRTVHVADAQAALVAAAEAARHRFQTAGMDQERLGFGQENAAVCGKPNALLRAFEQHQPQLFLQLGDLPAERRLRNVQPFRCAAHVLLLGHHDKIVQLTQVQHMRLPGS